MARDFACSNARGSERRAWTSRPTSSWSDGHDIRTVQKLLGHHDVSTTVSRRALDGSSPRNCETARGVILAGCLCRRHPWLVRAHQLGARSRPSTATQEASEGLPTIARAIDAVGRATLRARIQYEARDQADITGAGIPLTSSALLRNRHALLRPAFRARPQT
jgi:hypothetical protein